MRTSFFLVVGLACLLLQGLQAQTPTDETIAVSIRKLDSEDFQERQAALYALESDGSPAAVDALVAALGSTRPDVTDSAVLSLFRLDGPEVRSKLAAELHNLRSPARVGAAAFFAQYSQDPLSLDRTREAASQLPQLREALLERLDDPDALVRTRAAEALGGFAHRRLLFMNTLDTAQKLTAVLKEDPDPMVRSSTAIALGRIGPTAAVAVPTLVGALGRPDLRKANEQGTFRLYPPLPVVAAIALGRIGPAAKDAVPALTMAISGEKTVGIHAIDALGRIGPGAKDAVPALIWALRRGAEVDRLNQADNAAVALGHIGPEALAAVPTLVAALGDRRSSLSGRAAYALAAMGSVAVPELTRTLQAPSLRTRWNAINVLGSIGADANAAVPALVVALGQPDTASNAANALVGIGEAVRAVVPQLIPLLRNKNERVRLAAAYTLWKIGPLDQRSQPDVAEILQKRDSSIPTYSADEVTREARRLNGRRVRVYGYPLSLSVATTAGCGRFIVCNHVGTSVTLGSNPDRREGQLFVEDAGHGGPVRGDPETDDGTVLVSSPMQFRGAGLLELVGTLVYQEGEEVLYNMRLERLDVTSSRRVESKARSPWKVFAPISVGDFPIIIKRNHN